ncbi:MAG TPA: ABC transporter ATP-binding protein [Trebonia sp.]|jgi:peptide/nickel transport system ATP-binding protein|nr:ABC transporter ATP-binding protein [Trebonia sp.]
MTVNTEQPLLDVRDLAVTFNTDRGAVRAVDGVTLRIDRGQTLGLVGESGSGKSALAQALMRLLPAGTTVTGRLDFAGTDVLALNGRELRRLRGRAIGMVFQDPNATLNPVRTIGAQLAETVRVQLGQGRAAARRTAVDLLGQVGLPTPERQLSVYPHELSGGMRQRAMIALALAGEPDLLIADEATTALDVSVQAQILALLRGIIDSRRMSMLMITHDLGVAASISDQLAVMYAGRLAEFGPATGVLDRPEHPYTDALLKCVPAFDSVAGLPLVTIEGQAPDPRQRPPGCAFAPRCGFAEARCATDVPALSPRGPARLAACWVTESGRPITGPARPAEPTEPAELAEPAGARAGVGEGAATAAAPLLAVDHLKVAYRVRSGVFDRGPSTLVAVRGMDFELGAGETLGLVGESGSGKSSAARAVLRLEPAASGRIAFAGRDLNRLSGRALRGVRPDLQMVMQDITTSLNPRFTVGQVIAEPIIAQRTVPAHQRAAYIGELLDAVSLPRHVADWQARDLSGGQRQRVNIARALASKPTLIVADEPTSALDVSVRAQILNLMKSLQRERGLAYLFISHDLAVVRQMSDRIAVLYLGKLVEVGSRDEICETPRHPYTQALLAAVPTVERRQDPLAVLAGEAPSPLRPPSGCPFRTRCPRAADICATDEPVLEPAGATHAVACHFPGAAGTPLASPERQETTAP